MSSARQDAKHEKILRELLRQPENKRCPNCDSLGPQYVVSQFHIFVCTVCSGVHRQFGHRVKGVSMSTFKPEEIKALQEGGNGPFLAHYLAKWSQTQLPKPTDRNVERIREWIQAVYESKRFFDADKQFAGEQPRLATHSTTSKSEGKEQVLVRQLSDVMGGATPKLVINRTDSSAGDKSPAKPAAAAAAAVPASLLDISSPKATSPAPAVAASSKQATEAWDAFGTAPAAAPAAAAAAAAAPAATDGWAAFGDAPAPAAAVPAPAAPAAPAPAANGVKSTPVAASTGGGWEAFGEQLQPAAVAQAAAASAAVPASPSPTKPAAPAQPPQPKKEERKEVPLDIFFPEFEQIRATGLLPNGQPALVPLRPQQPYGGYAAPQQAYGAQPAYGAPPGAPYGYAQQQQAAAAGAYGAPRPTVVIPQAPAYPGSVLPSPGGLPSPAPGYGVYSPQQAGVSPPGSAGSYRQAPSANGDLYQQHVDPAGLRSSTSSEPGAGFGAPTPQQQAPAAADAFSSLAPSFRGALPAGYGAAAPAAPTAAAYAAAPAPYSAAPSPAAQPAASPPFGSSSLFGGPPSLSAMPYDLSAPAAPKPKASGNPFA